MASLSVGIVGLPNVGKSTLFQALTRKPVAIAPYPFTTIDKNVGVVEISDERLQKIGEIFHSPKVTPTSIEFIDIAGLVKGAHQGEGLGNQFLSHIREVDGVLHVVRTFTDPNVPHVAGDMDPARDRVIVETELLLKDLETVEKRLAAVQDPKEKEILKELREWLDKGGLTKAFLERDPATYVYVTSLQLLTAKPILVLFNADREMNLREELEIGELTPQEREELGVTSKIPEVIKQCYTLLNLITFFTGNRNETRAWTLGEGKTVLQAAALVHSDFAKNFIRAEVIPWDKLVQAGSWAKAHEKGWARTEGKEYIVQDGDVIEIKHG